MWSDLKKHYNGRVRTLDKSARIAENDHSLVIRCDLLNFIFSVNEKELFREPDCSRVSGVPAISGTGTWQITAISYRE